MGSRWSVRPRSSTRGSASCPMRFVAAGPAPRTSPKGCSIQASAAHDCSRSREAATSQAPLDVKRAKDLPRDPTLDARAFGAELRRLIGDVRDVAVAELLITAIEPDGPADPPSGLRTTVRYDIVGAGTKAYRVEHVGEWEMGWRRNASGWQVVRWTASVASGQPRATARSSPRSRRRRSVATTRSAASSTSISTRGWRRSTRS